MDSRGFYLAIEALVSMALLAMILALPIEANANDYRELYILQKQSDLLKVWMAQGSLELDSEKMVSDFEFIFPGHAGILDIDGSEIEIGDVAGAEKRRMQKALHKRVCAR